MKTKLKCRHYIRSRINKEKIKTFWFYKVSFSPEMASTVKQQEGLSVWNTAKELHARKTLVKYWNFVSSALSLFVLKQLSKKKYCTIFKDSTYLVNFLWSSGCTQRSSRKKFQYFSESFTHIKCFTVSHTLNPSWQYLPSQG